MRELILTLRIDSEHDAVIVHQRTRQLAALLSFEVVDQTRVATAAAEIARNALNYGKGGKAEFLIEGDGERQALAVRISDEGPGIANLKDVLAGTSAAAKGPGQGIVAARRLMDQFHVDSLPGCGTTVLMRKFLPATCSPIGKGQVAQIAAELAEKRPPSLAEAFHEQNRKLLEAAQEVERRQEELRQLSHELEDTNRGVLALYAELDERAQRLRQADELKSRFLSNMSHEFRTPLNSIIALTHLLLVRSDGELTEEQEKQVSYIRQAANNLLELVNDLLDLAKVEAGKLTVRPKTFTVSDLFSALRGMMRPLHTNANIVLICDEPDDLPPLYSDEGKVSQILHNLISNALKFTEQGSVRVSATLAPDGEGIVFAVADTGIGIAPENQERIFHEFGQLEHPIQQRVKGTGLGLPLSRKLAELLGGTLTVESQVGVGSTFCAYIPCVYPATEAAATAVEPLADVTQPAARVLVIDDEEVSRYLFRNYLSGSGYGLIETASGVEGLAEARRQRPDVIFLDLVMPQMNGFQVLRELRNDDTLQDVPVVIITSKQLTDEERRELMAHTAAILSKERTTREVVLQQIQEVLESAEEI